MRKAIIILPAYADHTYETRAMAELGLETHLLQWIPDQCRLSEGLRGAEIIFVRDVPLGREIIENLDDCRGIIRYGIGTDNLDLEAAERKGIIVARIPDYGADIEVADHALALFLAVIRRIVSRDSQVRQGLWHVGPDEPIYRISGSVAGFIGFGRIARAVAERLRAFGVRQFLVYDPYIDSFGLPENSEMADLRRIASESDVVSLHAPAKPENRHIVDADFLSSMKPTAVLINTARGSLVDEEALYQTLSGGRIFGAGIDVFDKEPPADSPLLSLNNVVLSDHNAWYSETTLRNVHTSAAEQATEIIRNGYATHAVTSKSELGIT